MFNSKDMIWWYWLITDVLLIMEVSIGANGLALAIALTLVQVEIGRASWRERV